MKEWMDILLRSVGLFFLTFILVRSVTKKGPAKLTTFELMNYIVVAIIVALTSVKVVADARLGLLALAVWMALPILMNYLATRSKVLHDVIYGRETILIKQGKVMEENLKKAKMTGEELLSQLRTKNAFNLMDVEFAVMEPTGDVNVVFKSNKTPITPHDLQWKVAPKVEPQTVILDGNILFDALNGIGLNENWLKLQLENIGVSVDNVFIGQVDGSGNLFVDLFDDILQLPQSNVKEMLYAGIEKSQADLEKFALETQDKKAKKMYENHAKELKEMVKKLEPYLLR